MNKKYYTPAIEEFHVGFEYEKFCYGGGSVEKSWWYHTVKHEDLRWDRDGNTGCYDTDPSDMRVKFLDKSDIEKLGWKEISTDPEGRWIEAKIKKDEYCWELFYEITFQMVHLSDSTNYYCTEFYGGCKNKSELKRLMAQLGIIPS